MAVSEPMEVPVDPAVLDRLGWRRLEVTTACVPSLLGPLARALRAEEGVAHAWRTPLVRWGEASAEALAERLYAHAHAERPTRLFTYAGIDRAGRRVPAGFGAVSERVVAGFPHEGFPVLARAFVAPEARGAGLYGALLAHRLRCGRQQAGDTLRAVHLGTSSRGVQRAVEVGPWGGLRFVHVGDEALPVASRFHEVRDYLAFSPEYAARLKAEARTGASALATYLEQGVESGRRWSEIRQRVAAGGRLPGPETEALDGFFRAAKIR